MEKLIFILVVMTAVLTLFGIGLFGAAHRWEGRAKRVLINWLHIPYNDETCQTYT